ncbi:histone deacetylase [Puniceicoccales bacterium CK1056]|uniref:Histone deacetylase n=1 Tax=Oceanipulchritudo coccoides TaxID=2706888 RepID=A0A6B2M314_9BACT|nr:histone deacetylase [Oceanipulchritudo coccoides]NDV62484.1 histone deacetylase [Oceanipulchritudo coccoides]
MPRPVAIFYHPDCLLHDTGAHHPERPERLISAKAALEEAPFAKLLHWHTPEPVKAKWIEKIHSPEYRHYIEEACLQGRSFADSGETAICSESYRAALLSAGGAIGAIDAVFNEGYSAAFSLTRPPGHHASTEKAMGFCLFNNVAIAAQYAEETFGLERICIIDWDVHHGNGTQDIFFGSPSVLFCSLHQLPLYPHSGEFHETGTRAGAGLTVNCPFPNGSTIEHYMEVLEEDILPKLREFKPELFLISAGFDAHRHDPLADIELESHHYHLLTQWILQQAEIFAKGRVVSILEGGYHLDALAESVAEHVRALTDGLPAPTSQS